MGLKRRTFSSSFENVDLKILSRAGGEVKVKVPQIGWDGKQLDKNAVSTQSFILDSSGKNILKVRGAYHQDSPFCGYLDNIVTDETTERVMPLPLVSMSKITDELPEGITPKNGEVSDWTYSKKDDNGVVISEAEKRDGKWIKIDHNVPLYKQYYTSTYEDISEDKADGSDENGNFILTTSAYCYVSMCDLGFFSGVEIDGAGNIIKGTEGTYMVEGGIGEQNFIKLYPLRSGGKLSIGSRLGKVFRHPMYGVVAPDDMSKSGKLKVGKFSYNNKAVTVAIFDGDGNVAAKLTDRAAYKLSDFRVKKRRGNTNTLEDVAVASAPIEEEVQTLNEADAASIIDSI